MHCIQLTLSPDTERRLREKAAEAGQTLESYLEGLARRAAENGASEETAHKVFASSPGRKPLAGRLAHLNLRTPSLEEFEESRREMWAHFPREFPDHTKQ
jgi:hypothetical protein